MSIYWPCFHSPPFSNADWWFVKHLKDKQTGYVPRNFVALQKNVESEEWFAGKLPRSRAERIVLSSNLPPGTFLVRERETEPVEFALTIRDLDERGPCVKHYKIKKTDDGLGFFITSRRKFSDLRDLVKYYKGEC